MYIMMRNVTELLEKTCEKFPTKTAVIDGDNQISFSDFKNKSRRAASFILREIGCCRTVAVFCEKSIGALISFFAAAYADCCYSFFEPSLPAERLLSMYKTAEPSLIIADKKNLSAAEKLFPDCRIEKIEKAFSQAEDSALLAEAYDGCIDGDPLYLNFTSGSSGAPKGVAVSHRAVIDFIGSFTGLFSIDSGDIIANQAPFDFDVSVKDIYSAFSVGATMVLVPRKYFSAPAALMDFLCDRNITVMTWAVSALCLIDAFHGLEYRVPSTVKKVLFSGEVMPMKTLEKWMRALPDTEFVNLYGPTEITCNCTYHRVERGRAYDNGLPIGKAFPNKRVFLLGEDNKEIKSGGEVGEICVAASSLALGYYNNREAEKNVFTDNPLRKSFAERIYHTGDLGRYGDEGELYFSGRKDFQIKYMGHRIELEEIEKQMMRFPFVDRAVCIFDDKRKKLFAFYTGAAKKEDIAAEMRRVLPPYMIPGAFICLDEMPMNANGKIDRRALKEGNLK